MIVDSRIYPLAKTIVNYSVNVQPGDAVLLDSIGFTPRPLIEAIAEEVMRAGGVPVIGYQQLAWLRRLMLEAEEEQLVRLGGILSQQMEMYQCYISVRGQDNGFEWSDVPKERMGWYNRHVFQPVHIERRCKKTRWCVMRYPNESMCQLAETSTEAFSRFFYDVCCVDYPRMAQALVPLQKLMDEAKSFRITGPDTDLSFSVEGIPSVPCAGTHNIPDGECFTAPVKESVQGYVTYNTPSLREGITFQSIRLEFEKGKVVNAQAGPHTATLNAMLDVDEGGRYIGEFSFGVNPVILMPMRDTLFDEKICGSFHIALGACYDEAPNGNQSALHWDMVQIQRSDYGGGEIYCDERLIRKDGLFVVPELEALNPDRFQS